MAWKAKVRAGAVGGGHARPLLTGLGFPDLWGLLLPACRQWCGQRRPEVTQQALGKWAAPPPPGCHVVSCGKEPAHYPPSPFPVRVLVCEEGGRILSFQLACMLEMWDLGLPAAKQSDFRFTDSAGAAERGDRKPNQESWGSARVWQRFPGPSARSSHIWGGVEKLSHCLL